MQPTWPGSSWLTAPARITPGFLNASNGWRPFRAFTDALTQWNLWEEWTDLYGSGAIGEIHLFGVEKLPVPYDTLEERYKVSWVTRTIGWSGAETGTPLCPLIQWVPGFWR